MTRMGWMVSWGCALVACGGAQRPEPESVRDGVVLRPGTRIVDLGHTFDESTLYWPTDQTGFQLERLAYGRSEAGFFYAANRLCAAEHGGTHLDAPIHFAEGRSTADQVPLDRLVAPAIVIDIRDAAARDPDALLRPEHLAAFERRHGRIEPGTIALVRTGWADRWPDRERYLGDDRPGETSNLHFPGISEAAARALVERRVAAVGIDTASIDHGPSRDFIAHQVLNGADIPAFENLASLAELPPRGSLVVALPMKIGGGSGAPLRIIALLP